MIPKKHLVTTAEAWSNLRLGPFLFPYKLIGKIYPGQGDNMEGILCDDDDDTARCSHCRTFPLCPQPVVWLKTF